DVADRRQQLNGGRDRVQLASAVIRDHYRVNAGFDRESGIGGGHDAFQHGLQLRRFAPPLNVGASEFGGEDDFAWADWFISSNRISQVLAPQVRREITKAITLVALATAEGRRIHAYHEGVASGRRGTLDNRFGETEVRLDVELEPKTRSSS